MESPPSPPTAKSPLGRPFCIWLFAPVISMALAAAFSAVGNRNSDFEGLGVVLGLLSLFAMIGCSVVCAVMVGRRKGGGLALLAFIGIHFIYVSVAFAGCAVTMSKVDFR